MDTETLDALRDLVGQEAGIPAGHRHRLTGSTVSQLRDDAKAMRGELGLEPVDDGDSAARDQHGRFASDGMNQLIRRASGRTA